MSSIRHLISGYVVHYVKRPQCRISLHGVVVASGECLLVMTPFEVGTVGGSRNSNDIMVPHSLHIAVVSCSLRVSQHDMDNS